MVSPIKIPMSPSEASALRTESERLAAVAESTRQTLHHTFTALKAADAQNVKLRRDKGRLIALCVWTAVLAVLSLIVMAAVLK